MAELVLIPAIVEDATRRAAAARGCRAEFLAIDEAGRMPRGGDRAVALFRYRWPRAATRALVDGLPGLRWLHTGSAGVDHFVYPEMLARALLLTTSRGVDSEAIAEHAFALLLAMWKRLPDHWRSQQGRRWDRPTSEDAAGKTLGIVGLGGIGQAIAVRAQAFRVRVIGIRGRPRPTPHVDDVRGPDDVRAVFSASDAIVLCAPLIERTRHLINRESVKWLKPGAVLVNVGRGGLVDEAALQDALRTGHLGGAALDVFAEEPISPANPLYDTPGLLMTPHVSARSRAHEERMVALFADNLRRFESGAPLHNQYDAALGY